MILPTTKDAYDFVIIGSGFGGSVSAMRLAEKGYRVLVLERGKRFRDEDFARTNWLAWKYLWAPALRCFGILQISPFRHVLVMHGAGVGGGSLGYANVLMEPDERLFNAPGWSDLADWKAILRPHYDTARLMLGVARNPRLWPADASLQSIANELGTGDSFQPCDVGVYFGPEGEEAPDPFFGGEGPARQGCIHCGACMVGCRHNAKNTLVKNYLYFAEKRGTTVRPETEVRDIRPLPPGQADEARYEIRVRRSTAVLLNPERRLRARNVIVSAGVIGTLGLLFRCRDETRSLANLSPRLGDLVRTNSEELLGVISRASEPDYSKGIAITSVFAADPVTRVEPVRYPAGSSLLRFLASPLIESGNLPVRVFKILAGLLRHPIDALRSYILPGWASRTTILLVMQTEDNRMRLRLGRGLFTLFRRRLVSEPDPDQPPPGKLETGHRVAREFAKRINGIAAGTVNEGLLNTPLTAHILGGCPMGNTANEGVVDINCEVFNYPGLFVVDGSIVPANPGINPSLTITALAEYAMSKVPAKSGSGFERM